MVLERTPVIATEVGPPLRARVDALRDAEPDPFASAPEAVEAYVIEVRRALEDHAAGDLTEGQARYLRDAAARQVRFAHARLEKDRTAALDILDRLFALGLVPAPDGRYEGELLGLSTGLLADPFFEWLTRIYQPWLGKTFDASTAGGDNVFRDRTISRATGKIGWPEYRVQSEEAPGILRVFPFRSATAPGIEDQEVAVLRLDYSATQNPLPVRRIVDEVVELPGGYLLGKTYMRGLREFRRVCYFGLTGSREAASE